MPGSNTPAAAAPVTPPPPAYVDVLSREYETVSDQQANGNLSQEYRQRSGSVHRHYQNGEIDRIHYHENHLIGFPQYRVIGHWSAPDANGNRTYSGR
jgi:hypothetical protein